MAAAHDVKSPPPRIGAREKCGSARTFAPLTDEELSDPVRTAVESEFVQIEVNHDEMRNLKHATS
jgi:hypothetical protein